MIVIDFRKLAHEWKTFALAVATLLVGLWDAGASSFDWTPLVPDHWKPYAPLVLGMSFLILRRWTDEEREHHDADDHR